MAAAVQTKKKRMQAATARLHAGIPLGAAGELVAEQDPARAQDPGFMAVRRAFQQIAPGASPGTLVIDPEAHPTTIKAIVCTPEAYEEIDIHDVELIPTLLAQWPLCWINVDGLGNEKIMTRLGAIFELHRLALEDIVHTHQRPKLDEFGNRLLLIARMPNFTDHLETEQISFYVGEGFVLSVQEFPGDCFDPIRERIRHDRGRIRRAGADYLLYTLLDAIVDSHFPVLESYGERLEALEDSILEHPEGNTLHEVHALKRALITLRRSIWPLRDVLNKVTRDPIPFIDDECRIYFRDCHDHAVRILDFVEGYREQCSALTDLYLSSVSHRMNEVMSLLTTIATIFIPLTFIVGVYGMNFDTKSPWNMPELEWRYGYPACLAFMTISAVGMMVYFRRRGWLDALSKKPASLGVAEEQRA